MYSIHINNETSVELISYSINPSVLSQIKVMDILIGGKNHELHYKFMCNNMYVQDFSKFEIIIDYKTKLDKINMIKSDGNIQKM